MSSSNYIKSKLKKSFWKKPWGWKDGVDDTSPTEEQRKIYIWVLQKHASKMGVEWNI